jgi:hypothetical protein
MILLPDLLMDKCQRRNNSAIHGSHEIRVMVIGWFHHHHSDVVNWESGRLRLQLDATQKDEKNQTASQ